MGRVHLHQLTTQLNPTVVYQDQLAEWASSALPPSVQNMHGLQVAVKIRMR